jgi:uncharacterized membrane protein
MKWVLLIFLLSLGTIIVSLCSLVLLVRARLHRRNRVEPRTATGAPLYWLVSPQAVARLHRRLVASSRTVEMVAQRHRPRGRRGVRSQPPAIVGLCEALQQQALGLDSHLAMIVHLPAGQRRQVLGQLAVGVVEVERTAARLSLMSAELEAPRVLPDDIDGMTELTQRLDGLEAAHRELSAIEAGAGLDSASLLRPRATQPVPAWPPPAAEPDATHRHTRP